MLYRYFFKYHTAMENSVKYLKNINFSQLTVDEKTEIKIRGRPTPVLSIQQGSTSRNKVYTRQFNISVYQKNEWVCGCEETNALFCFPCLLFGGDLSWTKSGVTDLKHLSDMIVKHRLSAKHMNNMINLSLLGKVDITDEIDTAYRLSVAKHNELVRRNRGVLSKIINCVKFCGKYELLKGHDESTSSKHPGVFRGLVDFACELDCTFDANLKISPVFKGISKIKIVQDEILDSMLEIYKAKVKGEVTNANYLGVIFDETIINDKTQIIMVIRYELQGKPVERLWGFVNPVSQTAEAISSALLKELQTLIGDGPHKLIAQSYDGAAALGVKTIIKEVYCNAQFIHCYAHELTLILEKATGQNSSVRNFFDSLAGVPAFWSKSPQKIDALENIASHLPLATCLNFQSRTADTAHGIKEVPVECCNTLEAFNLKDTISAVVGIKRIVNDHEFEFWLDFFSKVIPHVNFLFAQLQSRDIDATKAKAALKAFHSAVQEIRDEYDAIVLLSPPEQKRRKFSIDKLADAKEVCDIILLECRERFSFNSHLEASKLISVNNFQVYLKKFPIVELEQTVAAYPMLEKDKLKTELTVLYTRGDFFTSESLIGLLKIMNDNHLQSTFTETVKLLEILITTPMITTEEERCFSTLKRIKTFLHSTVVNDRLSALAVISIENETITEINDFDEMVINHFSKSKSRRTDFIFM